MEINLGYCQCGCGEKTSIAKYNHLQRGRIKGQPIRFIKGHSLKNLIKSNHPRWNGGKTLSHGYVLILKPDHRAADANGHVREHILIAEEVLGKPLPKGAVVHHANEDRADNRKENLVICQDQAYHKLLHRKMRALKACGHANWRKCTFCKEYDNLENLYDYGKNAHHPQKNKKCFKILVK